jgi:PhoH-like ATPase
MSARKTFVLDTNVLLHDHSAIYSFDRHDVVIPIVVLEEIDDFKKGSDLINFEAREFIRELDRLASGRSLDHGLPLGEGRGRLFIVTGDAHSERVDAAFTRSKADHRVLAVADHLARRFRGRRQVVIISHDINLRMKARSLGLHAEDHEQGKVKNLDALCSSARIVEDLPKELISRFYSEPFAVPAAELDLGDAPPHQYFVLRNGSASALARLDGERQRLERVLKALAYGIEPRNAEQAFALDALLRPEMALVALTGKAGTGKTLLALAAALEQRRSFRQILLARPVIPLGNRDIGYLPGDVKSKLEPYMQPLWDNLAVIRHRFTPTSTEHRRLGEMLEEEKLVITPLAYIRGRSLANVFFIVDETQNLTPHEVKTIITRAGEGTKIVFTGDIRQIDTPYLDSRSNGLSYLIDRMRGQRLFAHVDLAKGERSRLADLASDLL